jgi:hypothetical protein
MGNRANVIFSNEDETSISPAIYLHWNGGAESIYAFIDELNRRKIRADQNYECARFIQVVTDYMDQDSLSGLSIGVVNGPKKITIKELLNLPNDLSDNGIYVIYREWNKEEKEVITKVRRFVLNYGKLTDKGYEDITLVEMSKEDVEKERVAAYKHQYNSGDGTLAYTMSSVFKEIQGKREIEN